MQKNCIHYISRCGLLIAAFFLLSQNAVAGNLNLVWDASTSGNLGGYILSYGTASKTYTSNIDVGNTTSYQLTGLQEGSSYYFAVKAYSIGHTVESTYSNEVSAVVPIIPPLTADFTVDKTSGAWPLVVSFTGSSSSSISSWKWNFGAPNIANATSQNAVVTYNTPGTYSVNLTVTDASGKTYTVSKANLITVFSQPPVANFSTNVVSGTSPLTVNFTDTSTGDITSRLWNFGDGTTSASTNPSHVYSVPGSYSVSLTVTGPAGTNSKTGSSQITVNPVATGGGTAGSTEKYLAAAYSFDENDGWVAADASGKGNHGTIKEAVRTTGKFGKAVLFDGVNDWMTVNDSDSLDLSTGLTIEAWVYPQAIQSGSILAKEMLNGSSYEMMAFSGSSVPLASFNAGSGNLVVKDTQMLPLNTWSHLATTYDGVNQRLYVNGVQVAVLAQTGSILKSDGKLSIGGNSVWGEFFKGAIDEIRIYNYALSEAELNQDLNTSISEKYPTDYTFGNKTLEPNVSTYLRRTAVAYQATPLKTGVTSESYLYLDASSTVAYVETGIYADNAGHPGQLLSKGKLTAPVAGATNVVKMSSVLLTAGKPYWFAVVGKNGELKFRIRANSNAAPMESYSTQITNLPNTWITGKSLPDAPISMFGKGYN